MCVGKDRFILSVWWLCNKDWIFVEEL